MGKRELKKQYKELEFNFVDIISLLDTTTTKKLTPFLVKQFNDWIQYRPDEEQQKTGPSFNKLRETLGQPKNELDEIVKCMVFKWAQPKLEIIEEFTEHMDANRLGENDINEYDNWNAIKLAINEVELKQGVKNKKNRITILHKDEEWLILKPLSMEASVNYGYGTKWCTSMRDSNTYFHKYSREGVLVFVINRKNGVKYAFYSSPKEYSVWTTTDARIDSMETTIPFELLGSVRSWTNFDEVGPNYNYFEEGDKENRVEMKMLTRELYVTDDLIETPEHQPMTPEEEPMLEYGEDVSVHVDIRPIREQMIGEIDPIHGSITIQGERTWDEPYPRGAGGGFDVGEVGIMGDFGGDEETTEHMGVGFDEGGDFGDEPQQGN